MRRPARPWTRSGGSWHGRDADRGRSGLLGRLARGALPPGDGRSDRLPDDGLPRGSHDVHPAEAEAARGLGLAGRLRIGVVTGDDLLGRLDGLLARGHPLHNLDTGRPLYDVRDRVLSANAYLGAWPIVDALRRGADVVVTGRVTDTGLTLAPLVHAFGWRPDAWDLLAAGTVAGHTIECGAQCSGGNCLVDWERIP